MQVLPERVLASARQSDPQRQTNLGQAVGRADNGRDRRSADCLSLPAREGPSAVAERLQLSRTRARSSAQAVLASHPVSPRLRIHLAEAAQAEGIRVVRDLCLHGRARNSPRWPKASLGYSVIGMTIIRQRCDHPSGSARDPELLKKLDAVACLTVSESLGVLNGSVPPLSRTPADTLLYAGRASHPRSCRERMGFEPQSARGGAWINAGLFPPCPLVTTVVDLAMMPAAEWHCEFVAHLTA
jgi:hypothetical protein